ncbi:hypothetical protein C0993_011575, partial [Termitomyces sp. T159_Od127]
YIAIISATAKENLSDPFSLSYKAFSPFFAIDQMTGSFDTPFSEATSTIPIPSSAFSHSTTHLSTVTVGTLSTSLPPLPTIVATTSTIKDVASSELSSSSDNAIKWCVGLRILNTSRNDGNPPTLSTSAVRFLVPLSQ